jgi:hypothetical protein
MTMKIDKLVLHIGPHKTGSTYIQKMLCENASRLIESAVLYPVNDWLYHYGHHGAADLRNIDDFANYINQLQDRDNDFTSLIISSENFDRWPRDSVRFFLSSIRMPVHIVYVYRDPLATLYSHWQEDVKFGSDKLFSDFLVRHLVDPMSSNILNPCVILDNWSQCLDKGSISIIDYDLTMQNKSNICNEFLFAIYKSDFGLTFQQAQVNKSFSIEEAELLRALNAIDKAKRNNPAADIRTAFLKLRATDPNVSALRSAISNTISRVSVTQNSLLQAIAHKFFDDYGKFIQRPASGKGNEYISFPNPNWIIGSETKLYDLHTACRSAIQGVFKGSQS